MSRPTSHEGTFEAEIVMYSDPPYKVWEPFTEYRGNYMRLPLLLAKYLPGDGGTLVIYHETTITEDTSGDRDTPNGPADVETSLVKAEVNGQELPTELAEQLFILFEDRIDTQVAERDL